MQTAQRQADKRPVCAQLSAGPQPCVAHLSKSEQPTRHDAVKVLAKNARVQVLSHLRCRAAFLSFIGV